MFQNSSVVKFFLSMQKIILVIFLWVHKASRPMCNANPSNGFNIQLCLLEGLFRDNDFLSKKLPACGKDMETMLGALGLYLPNRGPSFEPMAQIGSSACSWCCYSTYRLEVGSHAGQCKLCKEGQRICTFAPFSRVALSEVSTYQIFYVGI